MSNRESEFIKWFGGIAGTLLVAMIIGMVSFYTHTNQKKASDDVEFEYIKRDIKEIKQDIKSINEKLEK
jgi:hypothetical protein